MNNHIVKAYDAELKALHGLIQQMGEVTIDQISKATQSIMERKGDLAKEVIDRDYEIDLLETKVDELAIRILALRQPVASDLRTVIAALKISNQIERIADYAVNVAKRTLMLLDMPSIPMEKDLSKLIELPLRMFERALSSFDSRDLNLALTTWHMDRDVDIIYNDYLQKLFEAMIEDPQNVGPCTQLLFAAKNIERIGDQSTNIVEAVYTMITGRPFKESEHGDDES